MAIYFAMPGRLAADLAEMTAGDLGGTDVRRFTSCLLSCRTLPMLSADRAGDQGCFEHARDLEQRARPGWPRSMLPDPSPRRWKGLPASPCTKPRERAGQAARWCRNPTARVLHALEPGQRDSGRDRPPRVARAGPALRWRRPDRPPLLPEASGAADMPGPSHSCGCFSGEAGHFPLRIVTHSKLFSGFEHGCGSRGGAERIGRDDDRHAGLHDGCNRAPKGVRHAVALPLAFGHRGVLASCWR